MYFLQKDNIMLHFTLLGSSDITGSTNSVVVNVKPYKELKPLSYTSQKRLPSAYTKV